MITRSEKENGPMSSRPAGDPRAGGRRPGSVATWLVGASLLALGPCAAQARQAVPPPAPAPTAPPPGPTGSTGAVAPPMPQHLTRAQVLRLRQMHAAPPGLGGKSRQERELDQIGSQLLKGTPKAPAGTTEQTGGGSVP